ncbi:MAG TPA: DUF2332 family protein [Trebonia sp.]|nr:DUF2332 family protein [Trebonia sp.]
MVWRAGIDLNPLDVTDPDDMNWLSCLVWPGEGERAGRLAAAIDIAREDPPPVVRGDLVDQLAETAAQAPPDATLVVFHSAVLAYLTPERRTQFAEAVSALGAEWLSNEASRVLSHLPGFPDELPASDPGPAPFLLTRGGQEAPAFTDSHGAWIHWFA